MSDQNCIDGLKTEESLSLVLNLGKDIAARNGSVCSVEACSLIHMEPTNRIAICALLEEAKRTQNPVKLAVGGSAGGVATALATDSGNIYTGVCVVVACGIGFCAEHSAIAEMLKHGEKNIRMIATMEGDKSSRHAGGAEN